MYQTFRPESQNMLHFFNRFKLGLPKNLTANAAAGKQFYIVVKIPTAKHPHTMHKSVQIQLLRSIGHNNSLTHNYLLPAITPVFRCAAYGWQKAPNQPQAYW